MDTHWHHLLLKNASNTHAIIIFLFGHSREITYSDAHPSCRLDVYKPKHRDQLSPIIVFIYGGSWSSGNKYLYTPLANTLRELGYIVAVPDYRKYPLVKVDAMYDDVRRAIKWAFEHGREYGGDPNAIYVMVRDLFSSFSHSCFISLNWYYKKGSQRWRSSFCTRHLQGCYRKGQIYRDWKLECQGELVSRQTQPDRWS